MSDFKSKLPDLKELGSMTCKLFSDIKKSVSEIVHDYKQKRDTQEAQEMANDSLNARETTVTPEAPVVKPVRKTVKAKETTAPIDPTNPVEPPPPRAAKEKVNIKQEDDKNI